MTCEYCNNNTSGNENPENQCCWAIAMKIKKFKKRVVRNFIVEALFDMTISMLSVVTDIITLIHYFQKKKYTFAILTLLPVILPTTVFTNVYMTDSISGYCKLPPKKVIKPKVKNSETSVLNRLAQEAELRKCSPFNVLACISGILHSIFHKDRNIRKRGARIARKSMRRGAKYFFGTMVLRFIAFSWYVKALLFGYKAVKAPKKYMNIETPDLHWSRDLLVRLDFLQASLENAPQCIVQLFALLTDASEDRPLGMITLACSFIDFVRVTTTLLWNVQKGPVSAPENSYGSLIWQLMNVTSWIFLYMARCCALSLVIGTAFKSKSGITVAVPIIALFLHCTIFALLFSRLKIGQASEKLVVTTFISIFFLPELDIKDVHVIVQFYYAMVLLENTVFIVPFHGDLNFSGYCYEKTNTTHVIAETYNSSRTMPIPMRSVVERDCLVDPIIIVLLVPALTIVGIVFRLAASQKMTKFKSLHPEPDTPMTMEEKVHNIYSKSSFLFLIVQINLLVAIPKFKKLLKKRWTKMTVRQLWNAFTRMIRKEVTPKSKKDNKTEENELEDDFNEAVQLGLFENKFQAKLRASTNLIRDSSISLICQNQNNGKDGGGGQSNLDKDVAKEDQEKYEIFDIYYKRFNRGNEPQNHFSREPGYFNSIRRPGQNSLPLMNNVQLLKVETSQGLQIFESIHI